MSRTQVVSSYTCCITTLPLQQEGGSLRAIFWQEQKGTIQDDAVQSDAVGFIAKSHCKKYLRCQTSICVSSNISRETSVCAERMANPEVFADGRADLNTIDGAISNSILPKG